LDLVFTIISRNYAAQAACLMESLSQAEPSARRVVVATDGPIPALAGRAEVIDAATLDAPFDAMRLYYDALELNTAVKPYAFRRLLAESGVGSVTYLDPDIWVYRPLDVVREALTHADLCLTPHLTRPLSGPGQPDDHTILQSGSYNLGFMAARRHEEVFGLLDWWAEKCRLDCRVDFAGGLFTDQRWMDLAPGFVSRFARLRQSGLNLAYWNLPGRTLTRESSGWQVDGEPLDFFHFSGFDPARPHNLSKHQSRIVVAPGSDLAKLLEDYAEALKRNGHAATRAVPYAHDRFESGRAVTGPMRRRALRALRSQGERVPEGLGPAAEAWLDAADPATAANALPDVTRLMDEVWREAPEAARFDRATAHGRLAFHAWFAQESGADAAAVAAARALLRAYDDGGREAIDPPWRDAPQRGPSAQAFDWLRQAPPAAGPRALQALAAARGDLRSRFAGDEAGLLAWCLGSESIGGRFSADLLPDETLATLAADAALLSRPARLAAPDAEGLRGQLFAAFSLPRRARWPAALAEPLQAPLTAPAAGLPPPFIEAFAAIWRARADLQRIFPLATPKGRFAFLRWLLGGGLAEYGVDVQALPPAVRNHPLMRLARLTVRRPPPEPAIEIAMGRRYILVVAEDGDAPPASMPGDMQAYFAAQGDFRDATGASRPAPAKVDVVCFLTDPAFVPADAIALRARGVTWARAAGVWSPATVAGLDEACPALSFIDDIWSTEAGGPALFRPRKQLDRAKPLEAALAALLTA